MDSIEISGVLGMTAAVLLTLNICMGIAMRTAYKKWSIWKQLPDKFKIFKMIDLHNYTSYGVIALVLIHILILPLDPNSGFSYASILWPIKNNHQPLFVWLGYFSFVALLVVIITTQKVIKKLLGVKLWKNIHVISYLTGLLFIAHAIVMDPLLKDRPTDFIDTEKVFMEICGIILIIAFYWRYQYNKKQTNSK